MPFLKKNMFLIGQVVNKGLVTTYINNTCFSLMLEGKANWS
jgi:hypothetical protein